MVMLKSVGVLLSISLSEITPNDLFFYVIYNPDYYQIKGDQLREMHCINSVVVSL